MSKSVLEKDSEKKHILDEFTALRKEASGSTTKE